MGVRGEQGKLVAAVDNFVASQPQKKSVKRANGAPSHLRREGSAFYKAMRKQHLTLDDAAALTILTRAAECIDTIAAARAAMAKDGEIIRNQYDLPKLQPAVTVEKSARDGFFAAMRLLGIDNGVFSLRLALSSQGRT